MSRPEDFSLTFGFLSDSWEREHCFTTAAACYDYLGFDPAGSASFVEWAGDDSLLERQFVLNSDQLNQLWAAVQALELSATAKHYQSGNGNPEPRYFLRASYRSTDHILIARGRPPKLEPLTEAVDAITASEFVRAIRPAPPADTPKAVYLAQRSWRGDR
ncbi:MAG: hypothetical protein KDB90_03420 [Planctomycetes bacterium]|nr:hypothetical protein [Planctomycetota bacterium]